MLVPDDGDGPFPFPPNFLWGVATADHQIEHAQDDDWSAFEQRVSEQRVSGTTERVSGTAPPVSGTIRGIGDVPAEWIAKKTDHDRLFADDFAEAAALGVRLYRFSISWARLFPRADMLEPDPAGVAFYDRLFDALVANGLTPFVTLFHFALPRWLAEPDASGRRGVERPDAPLAFERFAAAVAERYGDRVAHWCTINEPMVYAYAGYMEGIFPPHERRPTPAAIVPVLRGLLAMHARAYQALHGVRHFTSGTSGVRHCHVGIAQHVRRFLPWRNSALDRITAALIDAQFVRFFLDAIRDGEARLPPFGPTVRVEGLRGTQDYVGVNYYGRFYVETTWRRPGKFTLHTFDPSEPADERSDLGWTADEEGLRLTLARFHRDYALPLHILECGIADNAPDDLRRQRFLVRHAQATWRAIHHDAVPVKSFCYWSLLDNFEWAEGFDPRFGLLAVDYGGEFARRRRPSAEVYRDIASANAVSAGLWRRYRR